MKLHWQILIALIAAAIVGSLVPAEGWWIDAFDLIGTFFLNALKMLIVPLIVSSIIVGVMGLPGERELGRLGGKTLAYYVVTSLCAILIGLFFVNLLSPGEIDGQPAGDRLGLDASTGQVLERIEGSGTGDVIGIVLRLVPPNIVNAAAAGQMLGLIAFSILFGFLAARLQGQPGEVLKDFWEGVYQVMLQMTHLVMRIAPLGVFGLVAEVVAQTGFDAIRPLFVFFMTVVLALAAHLLLTMPVMLALVARVNPFKHYAAMSPALLTAFSTSSSSATLPVTLDCVENRAGVSNKTSSFVLPLGATVNMDGTALYECVAAMFIAQAYGLDLTLGTQFVIVLTALLTSIGVAGIPSASLVAIGVILTAIGLPLEGVGLILAVDRVLDMCRTAVNVFSDSTGAVVIARSEGEQTRLGKH
ncbi:dicarboxylate/amino acid:cation symporter [Abyssibacter profundi]|uniref:Dicarboxylate/amino acid:cation symporter n=1 Tax=Abyssibacter profundi TaxID=2182787 RepID=A0A363UQM7_9GAMM|nr:dicarboxylate/amino acid:cation symporter [Abyssibacter profundi]PWN57746.1 dicarboxylate/amino acid:cation symporter [Abyssibacter profundi]